MNNDQVTMEEGRRKGGKPVVLVVGPYPPPYAGPEMAIKMLLESPLNETCELVHLSTNVRKSNADKGQFGPALVAAFFTYVIRLVGALARQRPDIVYSFVTATRMGWLGRDVWTIALSRLFGAKVVIHMRGGHFRHRLKAASRAEIALVRWACRRAHKCLVQGPSLRDQFEGLARSEAIAVVPNMIDVERFSAVPPEECEPGRILFLGHITVAKGYCEVLKAIPQIADEFPGAIFEFAGTKKSRERNVYHVQTSGAPLPNEDPEQCWQQYVGERFTGAYRYLGILDEKEKIAALRRCDFLILPSFSEGFSMAVLEAMAMGKPVVTTAVGAMRDYVRDRINGGVIEPGDSRALVEAIRRLLRDRDFRDRIAARNARQVRDQFSQSVIAEKLSNIFEELLDSTNRQVGMGKRFM